MFVSEVTSVFGFLHISLKCTIFWKLAPFPSTGRMNIYETYSAGSSGCR
jgi:hypothetical protein